MRIDLTAKEIGALVVDRESCFIFVDSNTQLPCIHIHSESLQGTISLNAVEAATIGRIILNCVTQKGEE